MTELEILTRRLYDIDLRRAEIDARLPSLGADSYEKQELQSEAQDLSALRRSAENKIRALTAPPTDKQIAQQHRREALRSLREKEIRADMLREAERFAEQGDHRNARLYRTEALRAREQAEREVS